MAPFFPQIEIAKRSGVRPWILKDWLTSQPRFPEIEWVAAVSSRHVLPCPGRNVGSWVSVSQAPTGLAPLILFWVALNLFLFNYVYYWITTLWTTPLVGIYPKILRTETEHIFVHQYLIAALLIMVKRWKQCSVHWLMNKQHVYTFDEILLSLKRKEILTHATTWMNLKDIMQNEANQTERQILYAFT